MPIHHALRMTPTLAVCLAGMYVGGMDDAVRLIRDRLAKAEVRATKAEKAWEAAKNEVGDLQTALRVLLGLTGESPGLNAASAPVADRQVQIVRLLRVGEERSQAPAEIFDNYKLFATEDIAIDTFRTTIWRMKDKAFHDGDDLWLIQGENGRYWKVPGTLNTRKRHDDRPSILPPVSATIDDDDDIPF